MPIVIQLRGCIDTAEDFELGNFAIITGRLYGEFLSQLESGRYASHIELFESRQTEGLKFLTGPELQGHNPRADQVAAVNTLKALRNRRFDAEEPRSFGRPVAGGAGAVFFAGDDDQRNAFLLILHGCVVNRHLLLIRQMYGHSALGSRRQKILEPDVGEGATHHDFMVAAPRAVLVEVFLRYVIVGEIARRRTVLFDGTRRRDVVRR